MKRTIALALFGIAAAGCNDALVPAPPSVQMLAVTTAPAALTVTTPSGTTYTLIDIGGGMGAYSQGQSINASGRVLGYGNDPVGTEAHAFTWDAGTTSILPALGGTYSYAYAINNSGASTGYAYLPYNAQYHATLWNGSSVTDLSAPSDLYGQGIAINDRNQVVVYAYNGLSRFYVWDAGNVTTLQPLTPHGQVCWATAINNHGDVAGTAVNASGYCTAVVWHNGVPTDLTAGGAILYAYPADINDAGQVGGTAYSLTSFTWVPFIWQGGTVTELPNGGTYAEIREINASGDAVGFYYSPVDGNQRAAYWHNGALTDLGHLGANWSYGICINDNGQVAGYSQNTAYQTRAFQWENGAMTDLGGLPGSPYGDYSQVTWNTGCINNRGQIAGMSISANGTWHAVLWDVSDPTITVAVDIKPGSTPNSVNPKNNGVIPVAILSTASFDATTVDAPTVKFGPGNAGESHGKGHLEDVNGDGRTDMVLHFDTQASGISCGITSADLTGKTTGGASIKGSDSVVTVGCK